MSGPDQRFDDGSADLAARPGDQYSHRAPSPSPGTPFHTPPSLAEGEVAPLEGDVMFGFVGVSQV
jgi:hypothetical protein